MIGKAECFEAMAYVDERYAYGSCMDKNMLCRIDRHTGLCEYVTIFPDENIYEERLHMKAVVVGDNIVFSPAAAKNIAIYNYLTGVFMMIPVEEEKTINVNYRCKMKYGEVVVCGKFVYVIPATCLSIIKIDIEKQEIVKTIRLNIKQKYIFRKDGLIRNNILFLPSSNSNVVIELNMLTDDTRVHKVGDNNNGSWSICDDGETLWLVPFVPGAVVRWNPDTDEIWEYDEYPMGLKYTNMIFIRGVYKNGIVYAIPSSANMVVAIEIKTGEMSCYKRCDENSDGLVAYMGTYDGSVFLLKCKSWKEWVHRKDNRLFEWIVESNEVKEVVYCLDDNKNKYIYDALIGANGIIKEKTIELKRFVEYISGSAAERKEYKDDTDNKVGKII